jgi:hypothetical protein
MQSHRSNVVNIPGSHTSLSLPVKTELILMEEQLYLPRPSVFDLGNFGKFIMRLHLIPICNGRDIIC